MTIGAYLYSAEGHDREVELSTEIVAALGDEELLWIDVEGCDQGIAAQLGDALGVAPDLFERLGGTEASRHLDNFGDHYAFAVETALRRARRPDADKARSKQRSTARSGIDEELPEHSQLGFVVGKRWLVTIHRREIDFLRGFRAQDKGETRIGSLSPSLLVASLLDWHLSEFLHAVAVIERDADALDERILANGAHNDILGEVVAIRRGVSELRLLIARQRPVFHGLSRPDFALNTDERAAAHFMTLADRFDRAVDEVERSRDVAHGSFDLFTSMTTQQTNELVKALTFLTALIGACAAVAGLLGMNFKMPFFETGAAGFMGVTAALVTIGAGAVLWARHRRWI
jgi:magnesium transporter